MLAEDDGFDGAILSDRCSNRGSRGVEQSLVSIVDRLWAAPDVGLPDAVLHDADLTDDAVTPSTLFWRLLAREIFAESRVAEFASYQARGRVLPTGDDWGVVDDDVATVLRAARPRLIEVQDRHRRHREAYATYLAAGGRPFTAGRRDTMEVLLRLAIEAENTGRPRTDAAATAVVAAEAAKRFSGGYTRAQLSAILRDPEQVVRLQHRLDDNWAPRPQPRPHLLVVEREVMGIAKKIVLAIGTLDQVALTIAPVTGPLPTTPDRIRAQAMPGSGAAAVRSLRRIDQAIQIAAVSRSDWSGAGVAEAQILFDQLIEHPDLDRAVDPIAVRLASHPVVAPSLTGGTGGAALRVPALDSSIEARMVRIIQGSHGRLTGGHRLMDGIESVIDASPMPLGLADAESRAALAVVVFAASKLDRSATAGDLQYLQQPENGGELLDQGAIDVLRRIAYSGKRLGRYMRPGVDPQDYLGEDDARLGAEVLDHAWIRITRERLAGSDLARIDVVWELLVNMLFSGAKKVTNRIGRRWAERVALERGLMGAGSGPSVAADEVAEPHAGGLGGGRIPQDPECYTLATIIDPQRPGSAEALAIVQRLASGRGADGDRAGWAAQCRRLAEEYATVLEPEEPAAVHFGRFPDFIELRDQLAALTRPSGAASGTERSTS